MSVSRLLIPVTQSVCIKQQKYIKQNEKNKAYDLKKKKITTDEIKLRQ